MSKRQTAVARRFGGRVGTWGIGLAGGLFVCSIWIAARAATPTSLSPDASATEPASETEKPSTLSTTKATGKTAAASSIPQVELINEAIEKSWADHHLFKSGTASDGEWCRRVFIDAIGRIPTIEELNRFLGDRTGNRRVNLVDRLLGADYVEEYAGNWSGIWTNLLIGRPGKKRDDERLPTDRVEMEHYLRRSFEKNKHYRQMVFELISATGANKADQEEIVSGKGTKGPDDAEANGAVNFLIGKMDDNGVQATAKTAQIFLGLSVQCTQCHNHPFNEWKQNQFWELNAFFRQTKVTKTMGAKRVVERALLSNQDFRGESAGKGGAGDMNSAELYYELRNGIMKVAYPVFVDGTEISRSGSLRAVDRRTELAKMIVKSDYMSKAIVNRMWAHFMGYGFTKPVDDMGPHNPPSHPELVDKLAAEFSKHRYEDDGYDLKQLIRWIVLSEPYGLSSRFNKQNRGDDPTLGEKPQFSHFYVRQMTAEQLYHSMLTATGVENAASQAEKKKLEDDWVSQFVITFGTDDGGQASTFNGSIPQTLMMFNGDMMKRATMADKAEKGTFLDLVANNPRLSFADKVNYLYLAGLARRPSRDEAGELAKSTVSSKRDLGQLQDLWWAILNSNEFILNH